MKRGPSPSPAPNGISFLSFPSLLQGLEGAAFVNLLFPPPDMTLHAGGATAKSPNHGKFVFFKEAC